MWHIEVFYDAAGYLDIIEQMKNLIKAAGKKSYTLVMGRPNSAKLANFPEVLLSSKLLSFAYED
jgi:diphthamide biosynthesis enzyme Dph1/Dph2-like protein